jgi:tetratricopeptide (TPR) repeat protein
MKRRIGKLFLLLLSAVASSLVLVAAAPVSYQVRENGNSLEVVTPSGVKVFTSDTNFSSTETYRVEIPLTALAPPPGQEEQDAVDDAEDVENEDDVSETKPAAAPEAPTPTPQKITVEYDDSDRMLVEANHFFNKRKYFEATEIVEELLRKKPTLVRAWIMKGSLMYLQGHRDLAAKAWKQALSLEPENKDIKYYLERYK